MHLLPPTASSTGCALTQCTDSHIAYVAANLRHADQEEAYAYSGNRNYTSLIRVTAARSREAMAIVKLDSGRPIALVGVTTVSVLDRIGSVWAIGTPEFSRHVLELTRISRRYARRLLQEYQLLHNHVHADNHAAIRWLKALGFTIHGVEPFGPLDAPFHPFTME